MDLQQWYDAGMQYSILLQLGSLDQRQQLCVSFG